MKEIANQKAAFAKEQEELETQIIALTSQKEKLSLAIQRKEKNHKVKLADRNDQTYEKELTSKEVKSKKVKSKKINRIKKEKKSNLERVREKLIRHFMIRIPVKINRLNSCHQ